MKPRRVVFVLGITQRTGTNLLGHLLELHPQIGSFKSKGLHEDYMLFFADRLESYWRGVTGKWSGEWNYEERLEKEFAHHLGKGVQGFIADGIAEPVVVAKSPFVRNLHLFRLFFPESPLIVLIRDGRSVADSIEKGFGRGFEPAARQWAEAVRILETFRAENREREGKDFLVIRYEDLVIKRHEILLDVFGFLGLKFENYPFDQADAAPVLGSSYVKNEEGRVHWTPVKAPAGFSPLERYASWPVERHRRFEWLAGTELRQLGYPSAFSEPPGAGWRIGNRLRDEWIRWRCYGLFARRKIRRWRR